MIKDILHDLMQNVFLLSIHLFIRWSILIKLTHFPRF
jgi:hypothetical protein